jgi:dipeptidyl aminopeptidase/acylaminoacyl peptidase
VYTGLGWAVLEPNVRGSRSYGDALPRASMKDIRGGDYFDLMTERDTTDTIGQSIIDYQGL